MDKIPKCEICSKPAVVLVRDVIKRDGGRGYWEYGAVEPPHCFCEEHQRGSDVLDVTCSPSRVRFVYQDPDDDDDDD